MIYLVGRHRVSDYARWKAAFDGRAEARRAAGLELLQCWRALDDPGNVFFVFEVADLARARAFVVRWDDAPGTFESELHFVERAAGCPPCG
ncbi:hypothetical protein EV683_11058 [Crenobacter luteus]|uniref:DUF3303 family protein n=1 Tax=Crenobacter luteus TaxID=1452487 RepID=UPI0010D2F89F|nr:DUF3303 family protein [Crenobacter luteus]TCP12136.1 hypothetical protein EV683_11058 [Crenobacter luteus]